MRLLFKINKELELMNYWGMINSNSYGNYNKELPPELVAKIRGKPFEEVEGIIRAQANRDYEAYERKIETVIRETRKAWELIDEEFYRRLEKIFKREFLAKKVIVYVTPLRRCNYNYNQDNPFFKISARSQPPKPQLKTAAHEQIHFMFHWHYQQHCESMLGRELTGHLKEALTFLINEEFQDLIGYEDQGYPEHKKLRERLTELWRTTKDLEVLIEQAIPITRECMNK